MYSLFVDTAYKYLSLAIEKDGVILASYNAECFKRQSEALFVELDKLFKSVNLDPSVIEAVYVSEGPGSYTGVRIAMSLAKVLCEVKKIKLYKISTLKLYAGNSANTMVIMDARASRAYVGVYDKGKCLLEDQAIPLDKIETKDYNVALDGALVGKVNTNINVIDCFLACKRDYQEVKDINYLTPKYLKESDAYYR